jgi:hypothetical protein
MFYNVYESFDLLKCSPARQNMENDSLTAGSILIVVRMGNGQRMVLLEVYQFILAKLYQFIVAL